jgi:hypothetical protein
MKPRLLRLCVAALVAVGFATFSPRASADTVDSLSLTLLNPGGNGINGGGAFNWTQNTPINSNFAAAFSTYCLDNTILPRSGSFVTHTDLTQSTLIGNDSLKVAAITTLFDHFYGSSLSSPTLEAAFQLSLWELVFDGATNPNLSAGIIQQSAGPVQTAAQGMLSGSSYNGTEHDLANASLVVLVPDATKPPNQAQIGLVPKGVPAPPAAMLAGIGVLALLGRARWNRKKATPTA